MKKSDCFRILTSLVLLVLSVSTVRAQLLLPPPSWTSRGISAEGDTMMFGFPPRDSMYLHNVLVMKFYDGGLSKDTLCYDCSMIVETRPNQGKGAKTMSDDYGYWELCRHFLLTQHFSIATIQDAFVRSILISHGATYLRRMTAANPCVDTQSLTRRGDTIRMDPYNWVEIQFDNDTSLIPVVTALFLAHPTSVQLVDLAHYMQPASARNPCDSEYAVTPTRQKSLGMIGMPDAWGLNVGNSWVKVAVIDNGVDWRRCELGGIPPDSGNVKVTGGLDFNTKSTDGVDIITGGPLGHGTGIASIVGAFTSNLPPVCAIGLSAHIAWGMAGIAGGWGTACDSYIGGDGVQILAYRIDPTFHAGYYLSNWAASAVLEASDSSLHGFYGNGAHVLNNSYTYAKADTGSKTDTTAKDVFPGLRAAAAEAYRNEVCFVAAKGNQGDSNARWPADFSPQKDIVAVGSSNHLFEREELSNYGRTTDILAPGGDASMMEGPIPPTGPEYLARAQNYGSDDFHYFNGTSGAAAHVSGVLALVRGFYPYYSTVQPYTEDWEGMLVASAMDLSGLHDFDSSIIYGTGYNIRSGHGFLRADSVLERLDPTGSFRYKLFHYSFPATDSSFGSWGDSTSVYLEDDGFDSSLHAGTYPGKRREITITASYDASIDTSKSVYAWGTGTRGGYDGWSVQSPNSQEPWCEITSGHQGITGTPVNVREGIVHNHSRRVTAHTFQYDILVAGHHILFPDSAHLGVSFSVFGPVSGSSGVTGTKELTQTGLMIWPSITDRVLNVKIDPLEARTNLQIVNMLGETVLKQTLRSGSGTMTIDTKDFEDGFYFCRVESSNGPETAKFLIRH